MSETRSKDERETQHRYGKVKPTRHACTWSWDVSFIHETGWGLPYGYGTANQEPCPSPPAPAVKFCVRNGSPARRTSPARTEGAPEGLARHTRLPEIGFFTFNSLASQPRDRTSHRANCRGQQPIRRRPVLSREPGNPLARDYTLCFFSPHPPGSAGPAMESPDFAAGMRSQGLNGSGPAKRKRSVLDSSPASLIDPDHDHDLDLDLDLDDRADASPDAKSRRLPGVKRACNECRQQKVSQSVKPHVDSSIGPSPLPSLSYPSRLRTSPPLPSGLRPPRLAVCVAFGPVLLVLLFVDVSVIVIVAVAIVASVVLLLLPSSLCFSANISCRCPATMRCRPGTLPELLPVQPAQTRLQDRVQLQAHRQAFQARRDGEGD